MKKINGFWVDENNNRWDCESYTEDKAIALSDTLFNCSYCSNCSNCSNCIDCSYCSYCSNCISCSCCIDCSSCSSCSYCRDCHNCSYCRDFQQDPERVYSPNIGSRSAKTTIYWSSNKVQVVCGCFKGNLNEFKEAVKDNHGDNKHAKDYFKWLERVETYIKGMEG